MQEITRDEALEVLELGADASPAEIRRAFEAQYNDFRVRLDNAPSPALRSRFQEGLSRLERAYAALGGEGARDSYGDLPASAPVEGSASGARQPAPAPSGPPSGAGAASGVLVVRSDEPCEVFLDDRPAGRLESPGARLRLEALPGAHELRATAADGRAWEAEVTLEAARQQIVRVELPARAGAAPVAAAPRARGTRGLVAAVVLVVATIGGVLAVRGLAGGDRGAAGDEPRMVAVGDTTDTVMTLGSAAPVDTPRVAATAVVRKSVPEPSATSRPAAIGATTPSPEQPSRTVVSTPVKVPVQSDPEVTAAQRYSQGKAAYDARRYESAIALLREAADAGSADAQYLLGVMYLNGRGVTVDRTTAFAWTRRAAEAGHAAAQNLLGDYYDQSWGVVTLDYEEAMRWYRRSADQGHVPAFLDVGHMYRAAHGVPRDYAESRRWYQRAFERGNFVGARMIAYMHEAGEGVPQDHAEAARWYQRALDLGDDYSAAQLGEAYMNGTGVARDLARALELNRRASAAGETLGHYNLGVMYERGLGVTADLDQAIGYYRRAKSIVLGAEALRRLGVQP